MKYDFDKIIDRRNTHSAKWDALGAATGATADDAIAMWVADMDFASAPEITEAIMKRVEHGIFGYSLPQDGYYNAVINWARTNYRWEIERDWIVLSPGVIPAMNIAVTMMTQPGDQILIQGPVYYHFMRAPENNDRVAVSSDLVYDSATGRYSIDFDDFERKAADPRTTMAMLCNPHNPSSRVWTRDELMRLGEICVKHDLLIVADEIHCDLILEGHSFTAMGTLSPQIADRMICMMAPSKTFNLAGFKTSNTIIPNAELRTKYVDGLKKRGLFGGNCMGITATEAAYTHGRPWLDAVLTYVSANYKFVRDYFAEHLPQVTVVEPEGTYLLWVDCSALGLSPEDRKQKILGDARVFLDDGSMFGPPGASFERINLACSRSVLAEAVERMARHLHPG